MATPGGIADRIPLHLAAVATANGELLEVGNSYGGGNFPVVSFQITGISGDTITFEGTVDGTNWVSIRCANVATGVVATTATANGIYRGAAVGLWKVRARISTYGAGTITVQAMRVVASALDEAMLQSAAVSSLPDVRESWRISTLSFTTTNDSDNTFTVPATTEYQILSIYVTLATTADAGDRQLVVQPLSSGDVILGELVAGVTQAASLTYRYFFGPGLADLLAVRDTTYISVAMTPIFLSAGQKLKIFDKAAVAATADDMTIQIQIASRSVA